MIITIVLVVSRMYSSQRVGTTLVNEPVKMKDDMTTCSGKLLMSGNEHTYTFWMFVEQWEMGGLNKRIFVRSHRLNTLLNVDLDAHQPDMVLSLLRGGNIVPYPNDSDQQAVFKLNDVRIQGWNHITISIYDKTLDVYLNGKLAKSFIMPINLQSTESNGIVIGGSSEDNIPTYNGFLSRFIYFPRVLSPKEIYNLYLRGPAEPKYLSANPNESMGSEIIFGGSNRPNCQVAN
tara:strand:+ start:8512 stop:9210 length:699 start_codon:yes stop_codon:yes gene_type:complete